MRLGFILGFLLGGGAASLLAGAEREGDELAEDAASAGKPLAQLRRLVRHARQAGQEASKQRQGEMLADYEAAKRRPARSS